MNIIKSENGYAEGQGLSKQFVLFIVINNTKKYKSIKKKLADMGYSRFTVLDTVGSTQMDMCKDMEYSNLLFKSLGENEGKRYNKTLLLVLENEEQVLAVMDEIEMILYAESKQPGSGIMFTIPIITSEGVRFGE